MLLKIAQIGNPILRGAARPLTSDEIGSPMIEQLIELMRETMRDANGVGLAAPQIEESIRLVVIEDRCDHPSLTPERLRERDRQPVPFHVLINPELTVLDPEEPVEFFEGCLSVPNLMGLVPRARRVAVQALDNAGAAVEIEASGWYARILQHELDHLEGRMYVDVAAGRSLSTSSNYVRHWQDRPISEVRGLSR